jgi:hypothetical protein
MIDTLSPLARRLFDRHKRGDVPERAMPRATCSSAGRADREFHRHAVRLLHPARVACPHRYLTLTPVGRLT